jgi:hypothetical protein
MGDAKNCEKLGSWAIAIFPIIRQIVRLVTNFFITAIAFFAGLAIHHFESGPGINVLATAEIVFLPSKALVAIRIGKIQQKQDS